MALGLLIPSVGLAAQNNPGSGDPGFFTFVPDGGVDGVKVNVASGDLFVQNADLPASSSDYNIEVDRYYNSLLPSGSASGTLGLGGWTFGVGPDLTVTQTGASAVVQGPSGYQIALNQQPDGSFAGPVDFDGNGVTP